MSLCLYVAVLWLLVTGTVSCAAGRHSATDSPSPPPPENVNLNDDARAAVSQQPVEAGASGSDRLEVQDEARQAAGVLKGLVGLVLRMPHADPKVVSGLTRDVAQLSASLDAIADSRGSQEFTAAVFDLCEPEPAQAAARIGPILVGLSIRIKTTPPPNVPINQITGWAEYFDRLGETLVRIPQRCRDTKAAMAQAQAQDQTQDQAEGDGQNSTRPTRAERHRRASMMLLCIAGGMLAPNSKRYPIGATARFGYALQQCQQ